MGYQDLNRLAGKIGN